MNEKTEEKVDRRKFNPGRPALSEVPAERFTFKLTPQQKEKLTRIGGAKFLRERIEEEPETA